MSAFRRASPALALILVAGCADLTAPSRDDSRRSTGSPTPAASQRAPTPQPPPDAHAQRPAQAGDQESIEAAHVLVAFQGSRGPRTDRSKEDALKLATEVATKARQGEGFDELAAKYSDDPGSKTRGGSLGRFTRRRMIKPFADAAFALEPGEVSGVVETAFGYHVIKRTN